MYTVEPGGGGDLLPVDVDGEIALQHVEGLVLVRLDVQGCGGAAWSRPLHEGERAAGVLPRSLDHEQLAEEPDGLAGLAAATVRNGFRGTVHVGQGTHLVSGGLLQGVRHPHPGAELPERREKVQVLLSLGDRIRGLVTRGLGDRHSVILRVPDGGTSQRLKLAGTELGKTFHGSQATELTGHSATPLNDKIA